MNPFTQSLIQQVNDPDLVEFVIQWDRLERLVIRVYKGAAAQEVDEAEYRDLRGWLLQRYPRWQSALAPHWKTAQVAGETAQADPFAFLLAVPQAGGFVKHWAAMQNLPAAREAINQYLMEKLSGNR